MKTHVRVAAAALILAGLASGCSRTTEGTVAMTTEPGPRTTSRPSSSPTIPGLPNIEIPNIPIPGFPGIPGSDIPDVPAPPNATTMTCEEYTGLDEATQKAVIRAILEGEARLNQGEELTAMIMAGAMCQFMPSLTVSEVVSGSPP
jgi:hypothetical protein